MSAELNGLQPTHWPHTCQFFVKSVRRDMWTRELTDTLCRKQLFVGNDHDMRQVKYKLAKLTIYLILTLLRIENS